MMPGVLGWWSSMYWFGLQPWSCVFILFIGYYWGCGYLFWNLSCFRWWGWYVTRYFHPWVYARCGCTVVFPWCDFSTLGLGVSFLRCLIGSVCCVDIYSGCLSAWRFSAPMGSNYSSRAGLVKASTRSKTELLVTSLVDIPGIFGWSELKKLCWVYV